MPSYTGDAMLPFVVDWDRRTGDGSGLWFSLAISQVHHTSVHDCSPAARTELQIMRVVAIHTSSYGTTQIFEFCDGRAGFDGI
jgi:hypothetical protein